MTPGPGDNDTVDRVPAAELGSMAPHLAELLVDAVDGGASVGFLAPLSGAAAEHWWRSQAPALADGSRALWTARSAGRITGTVGLGFASYPNGRHRAEIVKLLVHRDARGRGLGRALLTTAERAAAEAGATLLHLDTETGSPAERLYRSAGWTAAGTIPDYAADPAGVLRPTTLYYKSLTPPGHQLGFSPSHLPRCCSMCCEFFGGTYEGGTATCWQVLNHHGDGPLQL